MKQFRHLSILVLALALQAGSSNAATLPQNTAAKLQYEENKGQWNSNVLYKADIISGRVWAEKNALTYVYYSSEDLERVHELVDSYRGPEALSGAWETPINCHAMKVRFVNPSDEVQLSAEQPAQGFFNYFLGNDPAKWA